MPKASSAAMAAVAPSVCGSDDTDTDDKFSFQDLDGLSDHGINQSDISKLRAAGIHTINGINMFTKKRLCQIKGLSEAKVDKIKEAMNKVNGESKSRFLTANQVSEQRKSIFKVSTGSKNLDEILGGGVESMSITEVFGEFRCGKTQICHTLCVACQDKNPGAKAMYIDTEGTFRPKRIEQIAIRYGMDVEEAMDNVLWVRCHTSEDQFEVLDLAAAKIYEERGKFKILIMDSIMALFRVDYTGRGELSERQNRLGQLLSRLQKISEEFNVAVFITNQMTADPGANMTFTPDPKKPVGGHILAHASTTRVMLRKGKGESRVAKIWDSPDMPEAEAYYAISDGGIIDSREG